MIIKYYLDENNIVHADPTNIEGLQEIDNPVNDEGKMLPNHKNIELLELDENGKFYEFYTDEYNPDYEKIRIVTEQRSILGLNAASLLYLKSTDWYVIRKLETGIEVPVEITDKRSIARELIV